MRVCVIGTGYVGLVTGACLAYIGHDVICVDNNEEKVKYVTNGNCPQPHIYLNNGKYCNGCCLYRYCACTIKRLNNKMNHEFAR